jgi:hypothetical protein
MVSLAWDGVPKITVGSLHQRNGFTIESVKRRHTGTVTRAATHTIVNVIREKVGSALSAKLAAATPRKEMLVQ